MKTDISLNIPTPCHENWRQMAPVDKGRFCQSCAKQVVDFSLMTDQQILSYLSKTPGNICGRFADDQLQRPLQPLKKEKKKFWWIAAAMPLLMLFEKSSAQKKNIVKKEDIETVRTPAKITLGGLNPGIKIRPYADLLTVTSKIIEITGKVTDDKNNPLPYSTIAAQNGTASVVADSAGAFFIKVRTLDDSVEIAASFFGYEATKITASAYNTNPVTIVLKENKLQCFPAAPAESEVCLQGTAGGLVVMERKKITFFEKADTMVRKIFSVEKFKTYPNPVRRGSSVNIDIKNNGSCSVELFDNIGNIIFVKYFYAVTGETQTSIDIPSSLTAGTYYIRLVDDKKKKQYTDKIIVM